MELTFEKQDKFYVSEFQLTSDANLHIEKSTGKLQLFQRTIGAGDYAEVKDFDTSDYDSDKIIDIDFQSLVYPKWIKIKSAVIPTVATISTDGEVREVSYQAKEIEITSNGTTKVTADTGYTALGSVNVKVNVPTEGGGDASTIEYVDISAVQDEDFKKGIMAFSIAMRATADGGVLAIVPSAYLIDIISKGFPVEDILAVSVDTNMALLSSNPELVTIKDIMIASGVWEKYSSLPRITKEEFYAIPKSYNIRFTRDEADENWVANEDLALFFEEAWAYLKANIENSINIQLTPYPIRSVSYRYGDDEPFTLPTPLAARWNEDDYDDGRLRLLIGLDLQGYSFYKDIYPDGSIKYGLDILS